jgi:hypothetical protein
MHGNSEREGNLKLECGWYALCWGVNNHKLADATTGRGPGSSEEVCRDEPVWVVIHKCMEAALGISL